MTETTYKRIYALIVVLIPIINQYSFGGGVLDFDVVAMVLFFLLAIIGGVRSKSYCKTSVLVLILYTILITSINVLVGIKYSDTFSIIMRCGKYCLYLYIVLVQNIDYFDYDYAMSVYKKIAYLALLYIAVQSVFFYGAGITLPSKIGGDVLHSESYYGQEIGRLRAFYSEPAAMAYALLPFIVCSLFGRAYEEKDHRIVDAILITIGVILSTSGQGIICLSVVWGLWVAWQGLNRRISKKTVACVVGLFILAILLSNTSLVDFSLGRVFSSSKYSAFSVRKSGYETLSILTPLQLLFGTGYGNYIIENNYGLDVPFMNISYSSLAEFIFTTGIIGTIMLGCLLGRQLIKGNACEKVLIIAISIFAIGGSPLTACFIPLYLSFVFCNKSIE